MELLRLNLRPTYPDLEIKSVDGKHQPSPSKVPTLETGVLQVTRAERRRR